MSLGFIYQLFTEERFSEQNVATPSTYHGYVIKYSIALALDYTKVNLQTQCDYSTRPCCNHTSET